MIRMGAALLAAFWLLAAVAACVAVGQGHQIDPQKVRRDLNDILSAPEYNRAYGKTPIEILWDKINSAIGAFIRWLGKILKLPLGAGAGRLVSFILACIVIAAFVFLIVKLIRRLRETGRNGGPEKQRAENYELPSAGPLIRQAAELAGAGDYRGAFRSAYLASISYLDEIEALRFERSRTNWEYMRELKDGGRDQPFAEMRPLTSDFDRKFYGGEPCNLRDYEKAAAVYERLVQGGVA